MVEPAANEPAFDADWRRRIAGAVDVVIPHKPPATATIGEQHLLTTRADEVRVKRIEWLSPGRIPFGGITLLDGPGGIGKTTFLAGVVAAASVGRDFFTGAAIEPQTSLVVGVEDSAEVTTAKLRLYGANMERIHFVNGAHIGGQDAMFLLPDHVGLLERTVIETGARIVYVDALFSHLVMHGEGRMSQQVRSAMQPSAEMTMRRQVAFFAVRHWVKAAGSALERALGSVEFTNMARSTFSFGPHPSEDGLIVCAHHKVNSAPLSSPIAFRIVGHDTTDDEGQPMQVAIAEGVGPCVGVTADDLTMRVPSDPDERSTAAGWLEDFLADRQAHLTEAVYKAAVAARIGSRSTVLRAARSLAVIMDRTSGFPSVGTWRLPDGDPPEPQSRHSRVISQGVDATEAAEDSDAPQSPTRQGFVSHVTVASSETDDVTRDATGWSAGGRICAGCGRIDRVRIVEGSELCASCGGAR